MRRFLIVLFLVGGTATAQMPAPYLPECSLATVTGTYAVAYQGWVLVPIAGGSPLQIPGAIAGVVSIDTTGTVAGNVTVIFPSGKAIHEMAPGSAATINADCTGSMTIHPRNKGTSDTPTTEVHRFVYLRDKGELVVIMDQLQGGMVPMILGSWKRMTIRPNAADW